MSLSQIVKDVLDAERKAGKTHRQIAAQYRIPASYVTNLLNNKQPTGGITLSTFDRMFPGAEVSLDGRTGGVTQVGGHHNAATANGDAIIQAAPPTPSAPDAEALRSRITAALIRADLPADALKTALTVVQDTR